MNDSPESRDPMTYNTADILEPSHRPVAGKPGPSAIPMWWRILTFVAGATSGMAVLFSGEFRSVPEFAVRLIGATFVSVTVYTVMASAGADRLVQKAAESAPGQDHTPSPPR